MSCLVSCIATTESLLKWVAQPAIAMIDLPNTNCSHIRSNYVMDTLVAKA